MSTIPPPPLQAWVDMPDVWKRWFVALYGRAGGVVSSNLDEIEAVLAGEPKDSRIDIVRAEVEAFSEALAAIPEQRDTSAVIAEIEAIKSLLEALPERQDSSALSSRLDDIEAEFASFAPPADKSRKHLAPSSITVGSSPYTYSNSTGHGADVIVTGGGVSALEFSRDGSTWYDTGSYYGMFHLSPFDRLRVTYVSAPTMTLVPR